MQDGLFEMIVEVVNGWDGRWELTRILLLTGTLRFDPT